MNGLINLWFGPWVSKLDIWLDSLASSENEKQSKGLAGNPILICSKMQMCQIESKHDLI